MINEVKKLNSGKANIVVVLLVAGLFFMVTLYWIINKEYAFPLDRFPSQFEYIDSKGRNESYSCFITKGNPNYTRISKFLLNEVEGWYFDFINYVPISTILSDRMRIIFIHSGIVVNYETKIGFWVQLSKPLAEEKVMHAINGIKCEINGSSGDGIRGRYSGSNQAK